MIGNLAIRIGIVAAIVAAAWVVCYGLNVSLTPPPVELPEWSFRDLPLQIGDWRGERTDRTRFDSKQLEDYDLIANRTGAVKERTEDFTYRDDMGHTVAVYAAMFDNPNDGVYHIPTNCYRAAGWQLLEGYRDSVQLSEDVSIPVYLTTWERDNKREINVYWLQLGEHVLFDRADLGLKVRRSLAGREKWPALLKVMVSMPATSVEEAKPLLLEFAKEIAVWENKPSHHTGVAEAAKRDTAGSAAERRRNPSGRGETRDRPTFADTNTGLYGILCPAKQWCRGRGQSHFC